jgi:3-phosphoinositide dependent protein kinase-1
MRRRASRLIPITVSPLKPKIRQLMLTSQRLICVKQRDRGVLSIKCELAFRPANVNVNGKEKEKDSRTYIIGVEPKTDREFVVLTVRFLSLSLSLSPFPSLASSSISNSSS